MPSAAETIEVDGVAVRLSSPDREMFPGIAKREVMAYYLAVAPLLLPQLKGRPTALERWPDGVREGAEHFFQKHLPRSVPNHVHGLAVRFPSGRPGTLLDPDSSAGIAWAVQMNTVTFHPWPVRAPEVAHPDQLRIDLDPSPGLGFDDVREAARLCREVLDELAWPSFVKTSGSRGLHVYVPVVADRTFVDVRHAVIAIGRELERRAPQLITMSWWKEERGERVFVDFNQNAQDRVMASAYSLRPRAHAPVSLPIAWADVPDVDPAAFTLRTVPDLVASRADPWAGMAESAVSIDAALAWWERDLADGLPELPYPPDFPKMPGEPPRVQPSRRRGNHVDPDGTLPRSGPQVE